MWGSEWNLLTKERTKCKQGLLALAVHSVRTTGAGYFVMAITMAHTASTFTRRGSGRLCLLWQVYETFYVREIFNRKHLRHLSIWFMPHSYKGHHWEHGKIDSSKQIGQFSWQMVLRNKESELIWKQSIFLVVKSYLEFLHCITSEYRRVWVTRSRWDRACGGGWWRRTQVRPSRPPSCWRSALRGKSPSSAGTRPRDQRGQSPTSWW